MVFGAAGGGRSHTVPPRPGRRNGRALDCPLLSTCAGGSHCSLPTGARPFPVPARVLASARRRHHPGRRAQVERRVRSGPTARRRRSRPTSSQDAVNTAQKGRRSTVCR